MYPRILNDIINKYQLSNYFSDFELLDFTCEKIKLGPGEFSRIGITWKTPWGKTIFGSSGGIESDDNLYVLKALFESVERTMMSGYLNDSGAEVHCLGNSKLRPKREDLFPTSSSPEDFQYSFTNGVSAHTSLTKAVKGAFLELVERDLVLRSWYKLGGIEKSRMDFLSKECLHKEYDIENLLFKCRDQNYWSAASIGFPRIGKHPTLIGFGSSHSSSAEAISGAHDEFAQRMAFLFDESFDSEVEFQPTSFYHQEIFCSGKGNQQLKDWIVSQEPQSEKQCLWTRENTTYYQFSGRGLPEHVYIIKALNDYTIPLVFGRNKLLEAVRERSIHPIP